MVSYKPQFQPIRSLYSGQKSFAESVSDVFYDTFGNKTGLEITKNFGNDFVMAFKNDVNNITTEVTSGKKIYSSVGAGVGFGILGNFLGAYFATKLGGDHTAIERWSLALELLFHAIGYAGNFIWMSTQEGLSKREIRRELAKTTIISLPISTTIYPEVKNPLAEFFMNNDIKPYWALVCSQGILFPAYGRTIKTAIKYYGYKAEEFLDRFKYFRKEESINFVEPLIESMEYDALHVVKGKRRNGSSVHLKDSISLDEVVEKESKAI